MSRRLLTLMFLLTASIDCQCAAPPEPWDGPALTEPRARLTVEQLNAPQALELLDMSFFARPGWAQDAAHDFSGTLALDQTEMTVDTEWSWEGGYTFPAIALSLVSHEGELIPRVQGVLDAGARADRYWDVIAGTGAVWREEGDGAWSRASLPLSLLGRYVGEVRNCVATFVYDADSVSHVHLQCSQETAVLDAGQLGDIRAAVPARYEPEVFADAEAFLAEHEAREALRIPTAPLSAIDSEGEVADHFDASKWSRASTSAGALLIDGTLYVHPPQTRHGAYPYPDAMRHGVFSVTKSMAGALAMFYFAQRYGPEVFEEQITDHVPALADRPEWQGVTFSHALNMVTGTRAGETGELLFEPLELAPDKEAAITNIAAFGDYPEAPGEAFNYATTNTFVLSYALENYVRAREGDGVHYWDLVRAHVLTPIGAQGFGVLPTRDEGREDRIPILGLGAFPTLDEAAKIARLIRDEGEHDGAQLLHRGKIREALGRTSWEGYPAFDGLRYAHSFWSKDVRIDLFCQVRVSFMEGLGDNRVAFFPNGAISLQFTDEFDEELDRLVNAVERVRASCP